MVSLIPFETILHHLWTVSWQVCVLAALALLAERMYRNAPPSFRYWLWMLVVIRLAVPLHISLPRTVYRTIPENMPVDTLTLGGMTSPAADAVAQTGKQAMQTGIHPDPAVILCAVWLAGFLFILGCVAVKAIRMHRLLADETEPVTRADLCCLLERHTAELGIRKEVGLFVGRGNAVAAPAVIGVLRPRIVLPQAVAETWEAREIEPLLIHELVHLKRRDLWVNWFQILVHAAFFFHPAVWLANSRIRGAREEICDDRSIVILHAERERYSLSMIRVGEEFLSNRTFTLAEVGFSENGSRLGERIRRIMHGNYTPHRSLTARSLVILGALIVLGVMLACDRSAVRVANTMKPEPQNRSVMRLANSGEPEGQRKDMVLPVKEIRKNLTQVLLANHLGYYDSTDAADPFIGGWIEEGYAEALQKTRSPLKALKATSRKTARYEGLRIVKDAASNGYVWATMVNFNKGKAYRIDRFRSLGKNAFEPVTTKMSMEETDNRIVFPNGSTVKLSWSYTLNGRRFNQEFLRWGNSFINRTVLAGKYTDANGKLFVFEESGKAIWPDKTFLYVIRLDLVFAETDYFYLPYEMNGDGGLKYAFRWNDGKLFLYATVPVKESRDIVRRAETPLYVLTPR